MEIDFSLDGIQETALQFLKVIEDKKVIAFYGSMGAGKTTFTKAVCSLLGVQDIISSPTFSIINEYRLADGGSIYHMDLYRIKNTEEAIAAGVEDCLYSGDMCFVEWPERAPSLLPKNTVFCYLEATGSNDRKLKIKL